MPACSFLRSRSGEVYKEWERRRVGAIESLDAGGHIEIVLAERIANLFWRLKRLERYETEMIFARLNRVPDVMASLAVAGKGAGGPFRGASYHA